MDADTSRLPDVMVMPAVSFQGNAKETAILQDAACLAVEIVSVSSVADDYLHKLAEYEAKGIPEYWIVDPLALGPSRYIGTPKQPTISIYHLTDSEYMTPSKFRGQEKVQSATFPEIEVTAQAIFQS